MKEFEKFDRFIHNRKRENSILVDKITYPIALQDAYKIFYYKKQVAESENKKRNEYYYVKKNISIPDLLKLIKKFKGKKIVKHNYGFDFYFNTTHIYVLKNKFPIKMFYTIIEP